MTKTMRQHVCIMIKDAIGIAVAIWIATIIIASFGSGLYMFIWKLFT